MLDRSCFRFAGNCRHVFPLFHWQIKIFVGADKDFGGHLCSDIDRNKGLKQGAATHWNELSFQNSEAMVHISAHRGRRFRLNVDGISN
jgi:hypothetical protein